MSQLDSVEIPNRSLFRQPEVCQIASIQPYVLRSWEAEFPDLGLARTQGGPRVYRRADVERVLRLKHLLFVEGLTLAGARRKLADEQRTAVDPEPDLEDLAELFGRDARERLLQVRNQLRWLAALLARAPGTSETLEFELQSVRAPAPKRVARPSPKSAPREAARPARKHEKPADVRRHRGRR